MKTEPDLSFLPEGLRIRVEACSLGIFVNLEKSTGTGRHGLFGRKTKTYWTAQFQRFIPNAVLKSATQTASAVETAAYEMLELYREKQSDWDTAKAYEHLINNRHHRDGREGDTFVSPWQG